MRWFDEVRHYKMDERNDIALKDIKFDRKMVFLRKLLGIGLESGALMTRR